MSVSHLYMCTDDKISLERNIVADVRGCCLCIKFSGNSIEEFEKRMRTRSMFLTLPPTMKGRLLREPGVTLHRLWRCILSS